jgi:hypothetical protein
MAKPRHQAVANHPVARIDGATPVAKRSVVVS